MKTFKIECDGQTHHIGRQQDGRLLALDHDLESEQIAEQLGAQLPTCIVALRWFRGWGNYATSALRTSVNQNNYVIAKLALEMGADIHAFGASPAARVGPEYALRKAADSGNVEMVKLFLRYGTDVDAMEGEPIRLAGRRGHYYVVKILLQNGADARSVGAEDALQSAAYWGYARIAKLLLDHGADVHAGNDGALTKAAKRNHFAVVKLLLDYGSDVNDQALTYTQYVEINEFLKQWISEHG